MWLSSVLMLAPGHSREETGQPSKGPWGYGSPRQGVASGSPRAICTGPSCHIPNLSQTPGCSVAQLCPTLCSSKGCSTPGFPVLHYLLEFAQTHVQWVGDAIHPSHPLSSPSPPAFNLSQHQGLFQCIGSLHQVAKVLELQLQHQSFQWLFRVDFL